MSWKHRIATLVLAVLVALPLSGTVCAMACGWAAKPTTSHHGSGTKCDGPARPAAAQHVSGMSGHDCTTHDAAVRQPTTIAAGRADVAALSAPLAPAVLHSTARALPNSQSFVDDSGRPPTTPPATAPLVLRV